MEIIGKKLDLLFQELEIPAEKKYQETNPKRLSPFQVWEIPAEAATHFQQLELDQQDGWWQNAGCKFEGSATVEYTVNGHLMMGYPPQVLFPSPAREGGWHFTTFPNFTAFMSDAMNIGKPEIKALFARSLARDNNLSLCEFMKKYQG